MLKQIFSLIEIILAIVLVVFILLQSKGTGLGSTFGGDMGFYGTKRGAEKLLFVLTIVVAAIFFVLAVAGIILFKES